MTSYTAPGAVTYNYAQLEYIWTQAGGPPQAAAIAAAIAMAESGGVSTATDQDSNGSTDRGLWQINSVHGAQSTYDVMGNARAAVAISNQGQNWTPWTTYTSGAYLQYMQGNVAPSAAPVNATNAQANQQATLTDAPGGIADPFNWPSDIAGGIGSFFGSAATDATKGVIEGLAKVILDPIINWIAGIMGITAGGALVVFGILVLVRQTNTGRAAENMAGQAALTAVAPEASAVTEYAGSSGITSVKQTRKAGGKVSAGGMSYQYRPTRVKTTVTRGTKEALQDEANGYNNRAGGAEE